MHVKRVRCHVVLASLPFDSLQVIQLVTGDRRCVSGVFDVMLSMPSFLCGVLLLHDDLPHGCKVSDCVSSLFSDWVYAVYVSIGSMQSLVSCGQQLELAVSVVLQSVTRLGASALKVARFAVSALEAARFVVPTCQPSGHAQRKLIILARVPSADRQIPWPSDFTRNSHLR